ncbi:helix-turn-helix transcriptional regulator [Phenylobacterium sp.]|jgi:transcriptional regulator with XRE-family HTH domain|uniref:helix-turn-helix domain-containing protein n=1 Tax=Phenylobacterium sp. TaxID=1871053 RepID=UPI002E35F640|nr:helix-turn-helix transcriptional regulator [Phenylobacterium sp.]HEX3367004.1 helix-turn-helix transcriptional regulator [Phenylobacterium sp.]
MSSKSETRRDPVDVSVGARIRLIRNIRGMSQQALAQAIGITFQQVQKYERGVNRVSASMLVRIAETFDVAISDLFGDENRAGGLTDDVAARAGETGALELLQVYCRMPRARRSALLSFLKALEHGDS